MAETIITIEIAKALQTALASYVPGLSFSLVGVADRPADTNLDGINDGDKVTHPALVIRVAELGQAGYKEKLRRYPFTLRLETMQHADPDQITLYTHAHAVAQWLAGGPALTLSLVTFSAVWCPDAPTAPSWDGRVQFTEWTGTVNVLNKPVTP
jgi:hypothetical protein